MVEHSAGDESDVDSSTYEIDNFQFSQSPSPVHCRTDTSTEPADTNIEASSSKSKIIDQLIGMGFSEESTMKAIREHGEEDIHEITNALLSYAEADKLHEEDELNLSLQALIKMNFTREEASIAIERCGEKATIAELVEFICAAQMKREFDPFYADHDEAGPRNYSQKRRVCNEPLKRGRKLNTAMTNDENLIRLPNPMIGFGVPNEPGLMTNRPVPIPEAAYGPPYFYYENIAMAPKDVWMKISSSLYGIIPEFVDSKYFCAAKRNRGYVHNLPIKNRFEIIPPQHRTIQEVLPLTKRWWPSWDNRTQLNCLSSTRIGSAGVTKGIRSALVEHDGEPSLDVQKFVMLKCRNWNLIWVGKNRAATLEPYEMEKLLGYPRDHTRGVSVTDRYNCLRHSFQVDTVAYHLSVLKPMFLKGIKVLSLFTDIGGAEVALHRLRIPMNVVISVGISEVNKIILRSFWEQTNQKGTLEFTDVKKLNYNRIEQLMGQYGAFDLVIGGNRVSQRKKEHSSLFLDYCRILEDVRNIAARMNR